LKDDGGVSVGSDSVVGVGTTGGVELDDVGDDTGVAGLCAGAGVAASEGGGAALAGALLVSGLSAAGGGVGVANVILALSPLSLPTHDRNFGTKVQYHWPLFTSPAANVVDSVAPPEAATVWVMVGGVRWSTLWAVTR
jgi:hypothetical protein